MRAMAAAALALHAAEARAGLGNRESALQRPMLGYLLTYSLTAGDSVCYGETRALSYTHERTSHSSTI